MLSNALFWKIHGLHLLASLPIAGAEAGSRSVSFEFWYRRKQLTWVVQLNGNALAAYEFSET
jgi:hypothetical protein